MARNYEWQQRCTVAFQNRIAEYRRTGDAKFQNFLAAVCGGAGKTRWGTTVAKLLLTEESVEFVIVVATTKTVRKAWRDEFHEQDIKLCANWKGEAWRGRFPKRYKGIVITYNSLGLHEAKIAALCEQFGGRVVVIMDEIHHMADESEKDKATWGDKAKTAFAKVFCRILVSGTTFRTDKKYIPFVEYELDEEGKDRAIPHFKYLYRHGVANGICRDIEFHPFEGVVSWDCEDLDEPMVVTFDHNLDKRDSSNRLRIATDIKQPLLQDTIRHAHSLLMRIRKTHTEAGGIIWAKDIKAAEAIKAWMEENLRVRPVLVVGEGKRGKHAEDDIDAFRQGRTPWIISVAMVIEGTDIKRLRVGVYASNVTSLLRFLQAAWRLGRRMYDDGLDKVAHMFIPADPELIKHAKLLKKECTVGIDREEDKEDREGGEQKEKTKRIITDENATGRIGNTIYAKDEDTELTCPAEKRAEVERYVALIANITGHAITFAEGWQIIKRTDTVVSGQDDGSLDVEDESDDIHPDDEYDILKTKTKKAVGQLAVKRVTLRDGNAININGHDFANVHTEWLQKGGKPADDPSRDIDDLRAKLAWLTGEYNKLESQEKLKRQLEREERRARK